MNNVDNNCRKGKGKLKIMFYFKWNINLFFSLWHLVLGRGFFFLSPLLKELEAPGMDGAFSLGGSCGEGREGAGGVQILRCLERKSLAWGRLGQERQQHQSDWPGPLPSCLGCCLQLLHPCREQESSWWTRNTSGFSLERGCSSHSSSQSSHIAHSGSQDIVLLHVLGDVSITWLNGIQLQVKLHIEDDYVASPYDLSFLLKDSLLSHKVWLLSHYLS